MTAVFFNLLANSFFSLLVGLLVVSFFIWLFRVETDGWKIFLLSMPFVKIIYDLAMGVPQQSVLFSSVDPYTLPHGRQAFFIGAGFTDWSVFLNGVFNVTDLDGTTYLASAGDYLLIWLERTLGPNFPLIILTIILTVSAALISARLVKAMRFERIRKTDRANARPIRTETLGWRKIDIYESKAFANTPFTGGVFHPYVCVPSNAAAVLTTDELNAVIGHEKSHVKHFDLITTIIIQSLGDIFWFVPGYRWLSRKIDRLREVVADQAAVKNGIEPLNLASALLKLREIPDSHSKFILYSAFFRERSLLKERIERLLGEKRDKKPRLGWSYKWVRALVCVVIAGSVINSTFGGNHKTLFLSTPDWFTQLLRALGV